MSAAPTVSVVVVSRGRPGPLRLCLAGLSRLLYPAYEIVVVTDAEGAGAVRATGLEDEVKVVDFDEANISAARNAGIAEAAGEIVAFIDDDAVPEPGWLGHLVQGFTWPEAGAAGGFVRGRNGISFQWRARSVAPSGVARDLPLASDRPVLLTPTPGRAIKTEGTNMAVRRDVLAGMGGFDPAFRFYLDETDLNLRLAQAGHATAIVPLAEVHHAYAESPRRARNRGPRDLFDVGASTMVFLRKHCPEQEHGPVLTALRADQRRALLAHMVAGRIEPRDVRRLMRRLEAGLAEGAARPVRPMPALAHARHWFLPFETRATGAQRFIAGRRLFAARHRAAARAAAEAGETVTLLLMSPTMRAHRVRFDPSGVWEQTGGLWGRSLREGPRLRWKRFSARAREERVRAALQRSPPANRP